MTPTFDWMQKGTVYEPPHVSPATSSGQRRRAYLKHRSWVGPVFIVLAVAAIVFGGLAALAGWQAPQL